MFKPAFLRATKVSGLLVFGPMVPMIEVLLNSSPAEVCKVVNLANLESIFCVECVCDCVVSF